MNLTNKINTSISLLIISFISTVCATYSENFEGWESLLYSFNVIWGAVILWLIYDLKKKKDISLTLFIVSFICMAFTLDDYLEYGQSKSFYFDALEIILLLMCAIILKSIDKTYWITNKS